MLCQIVVRLGFGSFVVGRSSRRIVQKARLVRSCEGHARVAGEVSRAGGKHCHVFPLSEEMIRPSVFIPALSLVSRAVPHVDPWRV